MLFAKVQQQIEKGRAELMALLNVLSEYEAQGQRADNELAAKQKLLDVITADYSKKQIEAKSLLDKAKEEAGKLKDLAEKAKIKADQEFAKASQTALSYDKAQVELERQRKALSEKEQTVKQLEEVLRVKLTKLEALKADL